MRTCIYPGSFNPITKGHQDIVLRATQQFEKVIVAVLVNPQKKYTVSIDKRIELIKQCFSSEIEDGKVEAHFFYGLTVDFAVQQNASAIIRGIRNSSDYESEWEMEKINKCLCPYIESIFLLADEKNMFISSTRVRELISFGKDVSEFVPKGLADEIFKLYSSK